jgi:hypothetical protein
LDPVDGEEEDRKRFCDTIVPSAGVAVVEGLREMGRAVIMVKGRRVVARQRDIDMTESVGVATFDAHITRNVIMMLKLM